MSAPRYDVVIVGSGAGGAVTALECARAGLSVLVLEEGRRHALSDHGKSATEAMGALFRRGGMTLIMGRVPMGFVEGMCLGGSTEVNSGFWCRTPREILLRWAAQYELAQAGHDELAPHFDWAEDILEVAGSSRPWPPSTEVFARGAEAMGWAAKEVDRMARACQGANVCPSGCPNGAKGMTRRVIPAAEAAGAHFVTDHRAELLLTRRGRVDGVLAVHRRADGAEELVRIDADQFYLCCGATQTPALLRRSGIRRRVGNSLRVHPMLKVVARFPERLDADKDVLALLQVREFWPEISLGGAFFTPGHAAMALSENWPRDAPLMEELGHLGAWYVAVRGTGRGSVRPSLWSRRDTSARYDLGDEDLRHLSRGLARLSALLLAAGATAVHPVSGGSIPSPPRFRRHAGSMKCYPATLWLSRPSTRSRRARWASARTGARATLFHCAGVIHPGWNTRPFHAVNVRGAHNLIAAAEREGIGRLVAVSSNSPLGVNPAPDHVFDETAPYNPWMGYGKSKMGMEKAVMNAGIPWSIIRPPWCYGVGQPPRQTLFFEMIRTGRTPIVSSTRWRG